MQLQTYHTDTNYTQMHSSVCNIHIYHLFVYLFVFVLHSCPLNHALDVSNIFTLYVASSSKDFFSMPSYVYLSCSKEST